MEQTAWSASVTTINQADAVLDQLAVYAEREAFETILAWLNVEASLSEIAGMKRLRMIFRQRSRRGACKNVAGRPDRSNNGP